MFELNAYSRKTQKIFRIFSITAIFILAVSISYKILTHQHDINILILDCISIFFLLLFSIYPTKLGFLSIVSGMYSLLIFLIDKENFMAVIMFFVCISTLH